MHKFTFLKILCQKFIVSNVGYANRRHRIKAIYFIRLNYNKAAVPTFIDLCRTKAVFLNLCAVEISKCAAKVFEKH